MSNCFHMLVRLPQTDLPYRFVCTKCTKRLRIASGMIQDRVEAPRVLLKLTADEVLVLIGLLELRSRTPAEEHILQECYKSKVRGK